MAAPESLKATAPTPQEILTTAHVTTFDDVVAFRQHVTCGVLHPVDRKRESSSLRREMLLG